MLNKCIFQWFWVNVTTQSSHKVLLKIRQTDDMKFESRQIKQLDWCNKKQNRSHVNQSCSLRLGSKEPDSRCGISHYQGKHGPPPTPPHPLSQKPLIILHEITIA